MKTHCKILHFIGIYLVATEVLQKITMALDRSNSYRYNDQLHKRQWQCSYFYIGI